MSTEGGASAPVATATPGSPIHVNLQMPADAKTAKSADSDKPKADKAARKADRDARREEERDKGARSVLKTLGIPKEERDGLLKEIRESRSAKALAEKLTGEHKTRAEKAEAEIAVLKTKVGAYESLAKQYADDQFAALDESAQKFIAKQAGDSLEKRLELIAAMKESGMLTKQEAAAATAQVKTEAKPSKPATTSVAVNPKAPAPSAELSPKQQWDQLRAERPNETSAQKISRQHIAARFYAAHQNAIDAEW